jgi:hypothetical protein
LQVNETLDALLAHHQHILSPKPEKVKAPTLVEAFFTMISEIAKEAAWIVF